ncbi:MAG TPA: NFACT RNA binding domain-containing protein [Trueperaceae bacterium]|nr:NFACT RNA binding domain-containing protein [Trueperaceae bacterium]
MDGLLIAEQLGALAERLPAARGAWRFPDDRTAVLPLADGSTLWLAADPRDPRIDLKPGSLDERRQGARPERAPRTPFQAQLAARATGDLVAAEQFALDRVFRLSFGEGDGFVPERPVDLVVELTGRNANLILVGADGRIVGAQRMVGSGLNRHREIRPGVAYVKPPPYDKLDPRTVDPGALRAHLAGGPLRDVRKAVDGIGPQLYAALAAKLAPLPDGAVLTGDDLDRTLHALQEIVTAPSQALQAAASRTAAADPGGKTREERRSSLAKRLAKLVLVAHKRVADARVALASAEDSGALRAEADLLLARSSSFAPRGAVVDLVGFDTEPVRLTIDPALDAAGNAAVRYDRARRKEARAERARSRLPDLEARVAELEARARSLEDPDVVLRDVEALLEAEEGVAMSPVSYGGRPSPRLPGVRFVDPRGFEVLVGRSAKENDAITFGVAKSRDLWLHVQGYQGAHVVVRSQNRELPFDTVLFAARLAAGFSRAKDSDNVAVDYTERKHVWRVKGAPAGSVNIAHQKTVYVTPARSDADAVGEASE